MADFVDENALLVDRIGAVENVDPLLDLLDRILRRGRNHDHLEPVDADQLDRSGQLGLVGGLRHRETEHGQDILQLLDHLGRQDVAARHRHAGPVAARALVDDFENLAQLRDIARIVADQDRVRPGQFDTDAVFAEKRLELRHNVFGGRILERIVEDLAADSRAGLLGELRQRHDLQERILDGYAGAGQIQHAVEGVPELPPGHVRIQIQRHDALEVAVRHKVEAEHIGEGRQDVEQRRAVEHERHRNLLVPVHQQEVIVKMRRILRLRRLRRRGLPAFVAQRLELLLPELPLPGRFRKNLFLFDRLGFGRLPGLPLAAQEFEAVFLLCVLLLFGAEHRTGGEQQPGEHNGDRRSDTRQKVCHSFSSHYYLPVSFYFRNFIKNNPPDSHRPGGGPPGPPPALSPRLPPGFRFWF